MWRLNGREVGFPRYVVGAEEDGKYFCNITNANKDDEVRCCPKNNVVETFVEDK